MKTETLTAKTAHTPKPKWLRVKLPTGKKYKYFYVRITNLLVIMYFESFIKYLSKNHPIHSLLA